MEKAVQIVVTSADETYDSFCQKVDAILKTMPESSAKFVMAYPPGWYGNGTDMAVLYKVSNEYASLRSIGSYNLVKPGGFMMIKRKHDSSDAAGQWDPLEYIDPPLTPGVEYRTTERYQGEPVYVKVVDCGSINKVGGITKITHNINNFKECIHVYGTFGTYQMPYWGNCTALKDDYASFVYVVNATYVEIFSGNLIGGKCRVVVHYTKTTD